MKQVSKYSQRLRDDHYKALESLRGEHCKLTGLQLWRKLAQIEREVQKALVAYRNGEIGDQEMDWARTTAEKAVQTLFQVMPKDFFINNDPRGYALKIRSQNVPVGLQRDWGGYGCLAALIE